MPQQFHELDDLDPKEYALRVVNPRWLGNLEDRVRCALERVGFGIERLVTNPDDSMVTFWVCPARPLAHLESVDTAHATLRAALINVGCPCDNEELVLWFQDGRWDGAYAPNPPVDDVDPAIYLNTLPPCA